MIDASNFVFAKTKLHMSPALAIMAALNTLKISNVKILRFSEPA